MKKYTDSFDTSRGSAYHCAPMLTSQLPSRVEPYKLAARHERIEGLVIADWTLDFQKRTENAER